MPKMSKGGTHTACVKCGKGPVCERNRCKKRLTLVYCGHLVSRNTSVCGLPELFICFGSKCEKTAVPYVRSRFISFCTICIIYTVHCLPEIITTASNEGLLII
jgi:hypothetical protein